MKTRKKTRRRRRKSIRKMKKKTKKTMKMMMMTWQDNKLSNLFRICNVEQTTRHSSCHESARWTK